jgi:hypothetical protein
VCWLDQKIGIRLAFHSSLGRHREC